MNIGNLCLDQAKKIELLNAQVVMLRGALKIAQSFCNSLTADECHDMVAIPINEVLANITSSDWLYDHDAKVRDDALEETASSFDEQDMWITAKAIRAMQANK